MSAIEDAINRYGGGDEAYKQKLKEGIRDTMGYSNWMSKLGKETSAPAAMPPMKGNITPQGVLAGQETGYGIQRGNINSLERITGGIDTAAGSIASSKVEAGRSNQGKTGFENGIAFSPQSQLDNQILAYMQNPKNPDGSVKSLQQFESELQAYYSDPSNLQTSSKNVDANGNPISYQVHDAEEIKKTIEARIPKDFIGQEDKYSLMAQGFSAKQAEDYQGALRYDQMSAPEKLVFQTNNPEMAKRLETLSANKNIIPDIGEKITDEATGETVPKYSFGDLVNKYPNIPPATIAEYTKPVYNQYLNDDIKKELPIGTLEEAIKSKGGQMSLTDYADFMNSEEYKNFKKAIGPMYGGLYSDQELDIIIHNQVMGEL
jgi:hypothetical protein